MSVQILKKWKLTRPSTTIYADKRMREHIDPAKINGFLDTNMGIVFPNKGKYRDFPFASEKNQLTKYSSLYANDSYITRYSLPKYKWGRIVPHKWLSLSLFHRPTRHSLCCDNYIDLDMVNAQPQIVVEACRQNGIKLQKWSLYCENPKALRQLVAAHHNCSYDVAKRLFLTLSFGGSYSGWLVEENINPDIPLITEVQQMEDEIQTVIDNVYDENRDICDDVLKAVPDKWMSIKEKKRGVMSLWCQTIERLFQECVVEYLCRVKNFELEDIVPCQDGIMILKELYYEGICEDINASIMHKYGFDVLWIQKPFDQQISGGIPSIIEYRVLSDKDAAETIFKLYPHWVNCRDTLYVFDTETGMWSSVQSQYYNIFMKYTKELTLWAYDEDKETYHKMTRSYGNTMSLMRNLPELIKTKCTNDNWLSQNQNSSLGKILFSNGYYDFFAQKFYSKKEYGFNPDILFFEKINHDFEAFDDEDLVYMDDIKTRFFTMPLGTDVGNYFALALARGLAGEQMKSIYFGLGGTNCGKSVLTKAIANACDGYVGSFNAENLAYRNSSQDEAQIMRWAMLLRFKRLIFSNEMKTSDTKAALYLNGNMIKKISSGGDKIIGRTHGAVEQEFSPHFLAICMANDMPKIKPYDDAVAGRSNVISFNKEYVDCPENEFQLKKDAAIEEEIDTVRFKRAFVGLLIREHMNYIDGGRVFKAPSEALVAKDAWIGQDKNYIDAFLNNYEITNVVSDYVRSSEIEYWIANNDLGITMKKFGAEMTKYATIRKFDNVFVKVKKVDGKSVNCWLGIKKLEISDSSESEDEQIT